MTRLDGIIKESCRRKNRTHQQKLETPISCTILSYKSRHLAGQTQQTAAATLSSSTTLIGQTQCRFFSIRRDIASPISKERREKWRRQKKRAKQKRQSRKEKSQMSIFCPRFYLLIASWHRDDVSAYLNRRHFSLLTLVFVGARGRWLSSLQFGLSLSRNTKEATRLFSLLVTFRKSRQQSKRENEKTVQSQSGARKEIANQQSRYDKQTGRNWTSPIGLASDRVSFHQFSTWRFVECHRRQEPIERQSIIKKQFQSKLRKDASFETSWYPTRDDYNAPLHHFVRHFPVLLSLLIVVALCCDCLLMVEL